MYINNIREWIDRRLKNDEITKVRFYISPKDCIESIYENKLIAEIEKMFKEIGINTNFVDTIPGAFNLNRNYLETDKFDAIVEYCGVYPIKMDAKNSAWLSALDNCGEIRITVVTYDKDDNEHMNL